MAGWKVTLALALLVLLVAAIAPERRRPSPPRAAEVAEDACVRWGRMECCMTDER